MYGVLVYLSKTLARGKVNQNVVDLYKATFEQNRCSNNTLLIKFVLIISMVTDKTGVQSFARITLLIDNKILQPCRCDVQVQPKLNLNILSQN